MSTIFCHEISRIAEVAVPILLYHENERLNEEDSKNDVDYSRYRMEARVSSNFKSYLRKKQIYLVGKWSGWMIISDY